MSHGQRTRRITPRGSLSNSTDLKKFTRKDLENACRRITPSQKDNGIKRQRGQFEFLPTHQVVGADSQLKSLDTGVKVCARKYNEWKAKADKLQEQLAQKRDILIELTREEDALDQMIQGNNGESKKISKLKSEISATNTASESNLHYRLQLNYLHLRQRKNDMAVDAHMSELAHTLSSSQNELTRRTKMLGDIESGTSTAMHAYELLATEVTIERNGREQEMAGKEVEVENAKKMEAWRSNQESNRKDFQQALIGGHEMEKDAKLIRIRELQGELKLLNKNSELKSNGEDSSEEAFLNIKRATGVNSLEDVVQKFTNRQVQKRRLISEKAEAEERLLSAKNKLQACHDKLSQLRSNGSGETEFSRSLLVDASKAIGEERSEGKILKSTNSRLDTVIVGLRQGGMGLYQRLLSFHTTLLEGDAPLLNNSFTSNAIDTANDTLEMLKVAQQILSKMLDAVGGIDVVCKGQITSKPNLRRESTSKIENPNLGENNCRIQAKVRKNLSSSTSYQCASNSSSFAPGLFHTFSHLVLCLPRAIHKNMIPPWMLKSTSMILYRGTP